MQDLADGKIDALVTAPVSKPNVKTDQFNFTGHTEYLENHFKSEGVLMLMVNELMRIGVVTSHIPLAKVHEYITRDTMLNKLRILNKSLLVDFAIRKSTDCRAGIKSACR